MENSPDAQNMAMKKLNSLETDLTKESSFRPISVLRPLRSVFIQYFSSDAGAFDAGRATGRRVEMKEASDPPDVAVRPQPAPLIGRDRLPSLPFWYLHLGWTGGARWGRRAVRQGLFVSCSKIVLRFLFKALKNYDFT